MTDTMIERLTEVAWSHLEARHESASFGNDPAFVARDVSVVDGTVDMALLVRAIVTAMREPTEAMVAAAGLEIDGTRMDALAILTYRPMIDAALAEGT